MHVVFAHDNYFYGHSDGTVYSKMSYPYVILQRYLGFFETVTVAARMQQVQESDDYRMMNISSGPSVSFIDIPNISGPIKTILHRQEATRKLREALSKADALIARLPSEIGSLAIKVAAELGKPWAVEVVGHAAQSYRYHGSWQGKLYAPIMEWRTRKGISKAEHAIYVTKQFLQDKYPALGVSTDCSDVEVADFPQQVLEDRLSSIRHRQGPLRIGLIGALSVQYKGIDTMLRALRDAQHELPAFEFHVLGGGSAEPWIALAQSLGLEDRTVFCGTRSGTPAVLEWLQGIDLYVQPSLTEGLPRALVEAMSVGCPCLASTAGGIPELLEQRQLHTPGDEKRLAEMLVACAGDQAWQIEQATRNFYEAKKYTKPVLDRKRAAFWSQFAAAIDQGNPLVPVKEGNF